MPFTPLKKILESVMREGFHRRHRGLQDLAQWNDIVGARLAAHTRPVRVSGSVLYVEVDDHLWFAQLKYMRADMLRMIERAIRKGIFKDLKFFLKGI